MMYLVGDIDKGTYKHQLVESEGQAKALMTLFKPENAFYAKIDQNLGNVLHCFFRKHSIMDIDAYAHALEVVSKVVGSLCERMPKNGNITG